LSKIAAIPGWLAELNRTLPGVDRIQVHGGGLTIEQARESARKQQAVLNQDAAFLAPPPPSIGWGHPGYVPVGMRGLSGVPGLGAAGGIRSSCGDCGRKHVSQAIVLLSEARQGYPTHMWLAFGHLGEAADETLASYPEISAKIRAARVALMGNPDADVDLVGLIDEITAAVGSGAPTKAPAGLSGVGAFSGISSFDGGPLVKVLGVPRATGRSPVSRDVCYKVKIPVGSRGTTVTLEKMAEMAVESSQDAGFVQEARAIVADCPARDHECEGTAIYDQVAKVTTYRNDPVFMEYVMSPGWLYFCEDGGASDCDDQSTLIAGFDVSVGRGCRFGAYMLDEEQARVGEFSHVLCEMGIRTPRGVRWFGQDTVAKKGPGWTPPESAWFGEPNYLEVASP
jgi:hypothetical protein